MRLAFLTHEPFYPPSGGGSAEAVYLVREMVRRGHRVHVFCPQIDGADEVRRRFDIELHEFKAWRMGRYASLRNFKYLLYPFFLQRLVETEARATRFDLVFSQHTISAVAAGRLRRRFRVPTVMNFLDYLTGFMETWPRYLAPKPFIKAITRYELSLPSRYHADAVFTVSDTLADYFADAGVPRDRLLPIYYGFDAERFRFDEVARRATTAMPPAIVMHGSFDHHHLGRIAGEALAHVARNRGDVVFRFVGQRTPALRAFVERMRKQAPSARIECTGFVPYEVVARHLESASVGMVPYEASKGTHCAFVAKVVEYLALGLPVVSTPLNSVQRYFEREPLVRFSGFDGAGFGETILGWLAEPFERRLALGRPASDRVKMALDWQTIGRKAVDRVEQVQRTFLHE